MRRHIYATPLFLFLDLEALFNDTVFTVYFSARCFNEYQKKRFYIPYQLMANGEMVTLEELAIKMDHIPLVNIDCPFDNATIELPGDEVEARKGMVNEIDDARRWIQKQFIDELRRNAVYKEVGEDVAKVLQTHSIPYERVGYDIVAGNTLITLSNIALIPDEQMGMDIIYASPDIYYEGFPEPEKINATRSIGYFMQRNGRLISRHPEDHLAILTSKGIIDYFDRAG